MTPLYELTKERCCRRHLTIDLIMAKGSGIPFLYKFNDKLKHEDDQFVNSFSRRKRDNVLMEEVENFHVHLQSQSKIEIVGRKCTYLKQTPADSLISLLNQLTK